MTASASKLIEKKNALSGKFPQHNVFYKHCLKYCICDFEKCLFSPTIGKWYIFVLYHSSANFLSSSISPKAFFCWAQKKLNAHVSFFFSTMHTLLKSLLGKFDPKLGIWHQAFPAIKLWVNGSSLKLYPLRTFLSWSDHSMFAYCCEFSAPFQICRRAFSAFIY